MTERRLYLPGRRSWIIRIKASSAQARFPIGDISIVTAVLILLVTCLALARELKRSNEPFAAIVADAAQYRLDGGYSVVLFQPADCPEGMAWIEAFNARSAAHRGSLRGLIIADPDQEQFVVDLVTRAEIHFPTKQISHSEGMKILGPLGYLQTPVVLTFDKNGRLRRAGHPSELVLAKYPF